MISSVRRADPTTLRTLDAAFLLWCRLWIAIGLYVGYEVFQLAKIGTTLESSGRALDDSGRALQELRSIPLIGGTPGKIGDNVRETAAQVVERGRETQASTRRLGVLLGFTTAVLPIAPALLYLPLRFGVVADRRRVQRLVARLDPEELDTHLARRALADIPYEQLLRRSSTPETDFERGRRSALADAELARLGLRRSGR